MSGFSFTVLGHRVWVRKCRERGEVGGIIIPEKSRDFTTACEVVAIGPKVGETRDLKSMRSHDRPHVCKRQNTPIEVGQIVYVENEHPLTTTLPWGSEEFLVDECALVGAWSD